MYFGIGSLRKGNDWFGLKTFKFGSRPFTSYMLSIHFFYLMIVHFFYDVFDLRQFCSYIFAQIVNSHSCQLKGTILLRIFFFIGCFEVLIKLNYGLGSNENILNWIVQVCD